MPGKSISARRSLLFFLAYLTVRAFSAFGEGSGTWGVTGNNQANLMVPTTSGNGSGNTGYINRGYMLLPSATPGYNASHRFYVWVKNGETVFWGFHQEGSDGSNSTFRWFYDNSPGGLGYFPSGTGGAGRTEISSQEFNPRSSGQGIPSSASRAAAGPSQIAGSSTGYNAHSFTNNTGSDRAFWLEISLSGTQAANQTLFREFNYWDVTVASGSSGNYTVRNGRVYCKYWSIWNNLPDQSGQSNSNGASFPAHFGFHIPVDNEYTTGNDYFVKYADFSGSNAGYVVFFANSEGPGTTGSFSDKRKSVNGTSVNVKYPLFVNDPDHNVWPSALLPEWSYVPVFSKKTFPETGGEGRFTVTVNTPSVIDILIDLNGNQVKDGNDVLLSHEFTAAGSHVLYWNGKDAAGNDVAAGTSIYFVSSLAFFPVHFPIYDMEQSLGISIRHMRPVRGGGAPVNDVLYWDDSNISGNLSAGDPKVNTTGLPGRVHRWYATGDAGYSNNNTINTWTGAFNERVARSVTFRYDTEMDLAVTKEVAPAVQIAGEDVTFTIKATNLAIPDQTAVTATGVEVVDILPEGYAMVSINVPDGTSWDSAQNSWIIGDLEVGEELTMTIVAKVRPTGPYLNTALIQGNESEINYGNNSDDAGIATYTVYGNVFHDPDAGNVDISTSGGVNTIPSGMIYANLVGGDEKVVASVLVSGNGNFMFSTLPGNFKVAIENTFVAAGQSVGNTSPPAGWVHTGTFNGPAGTGNSGSTSGIGEVFTVATENVYNINFGMQIAPETEDSHYSLLDEPSSGAILPLNGTIQAKGGRNVDEIISSDTDGRVSALIITGLAQPIPVSGGRRNEVSEEVPVLLYAGVPVVENVPIANFDPLLLSLQLYGTDYVGAFFYFKVVDNGGTESNTSVYTVDWINPLPVKWESVSVRRENTHAVVSWATTEEVNVGFFEIQYSANARDWETIGVKEATNSGPANYQFIHQPGEHPVHYYRIQSADLDGSISRSQVVSLKGGMMKEIILYPNPVLNGEMTIGMDLTDVVQLNVISQAGVRLQSHKPINNTMDLRGLKAGIYILQVIYASGNTMSKTFIVK